MIKRKILVVEDERLIARDIDMQLCILGHEPLGPTHTGEQAIGMAGEFGEVVGLTNNTELLSQVIPTGSKA